jgi:hypothetical protein
MADNSQDNKKTPQPYTNLDRSLEALEAEVKTLEAARNPQEPPKPDEPAVQATTDKPADPPAPKPPAAEEESFKKRYGDLRRLMDARDKEHKQALVDLQRQLDAATRQAVKLPKDESEIEAWAKEYPDLAAIVETIAIKKAAEARQDVDKRLEELAEREREAAREKALARLMKAHPDFEQIKADPQFHEWVQEQPKLIQEALYDNDTDWQACSRALDLYKADMGLNKPKVETKPKADTSAAESVKTPRNNPEPVADNTKTLKESEVAKWKPEEFERRQDEVTAAIRAGRFVYDMSGAAR